MGLITVTLGRYKLKIRRSGLRISGGVSTTNSDTPAQLSVALFTD